MNAPSCANCSLSSDNTNITHIFLVHYWNEGPEPQSMSESPLLGSLGIVAISCSIFLVILVCIWHKQRAIVHRFSTTLASEQKRRSTLRNLSFDGMNFMNGMNSSSKSPNIDIDDMSITTGVIRIPMSSANKNFNSLSVPSQLDDVGVCSSNSSDQEDTHTTVEQPMSLSKRLIQELKRASSFLVERRSTPIVDPERMSTREFRRESFLHMKRHVGNFLLERSWSDGMIASLPLKGRRESIADLQKHVCGQDLQLYE